MSTAAPACIDVAHCRLRLREGVQVTVHRDRHRRPWFRLWRPETARDAGTAREGARFLRLGPAEYRLLAHLDGQRTLEEARTAAAGEDPQWRLSPEQAEAFVAWAQREHLLQTDAPEGGGGRSRQSLAWIRVPLLRGGPWLNPLVRIFGWTFTVPAALIAALLWMAAAAVVIAQQDRFVHDVQAVLRPSGWLWAALVWAILKLLHEAAHAISCHKFGGRVGEIGLAWMIVAPVAYVDLTDAYRIRSRAARLATSLAGVYVESTVAAVALLCWSQTHSPVAAHLLCTIAATAGLATVLFNLNPLMRLDGYYALTDWLDRPNLASDAQVRLRDAVAWLGLGRAMPPRYSAGSPAGLLLYAVAAGLYRISVIAALLSAAVLMYGPAGMVLGGLVLAALVLRPLVGAVCAIASTLRTRPAVALRLVALVGVLGGAGWSAYRLRQTVSLERGWPAVVEFVDDRPVRAGAAGFVRDVPVRDGQRVRAGQVLVQLENPSLATELAAAHSRLQAAEARSRNHRQRHETAQAVAEAQAAEALAQQVQELQRQCEQLTVRAPRDGVLIADQIQQTLGQWTTKGQSIGLVVEPQRMKAIAAVPQSQLDAIRSLLATGSAKASGPQARPRTNDEEGLELVVGGQRVSVTLASVAQQTTVSPPHPALSAVAGGPLAVRPDDDQQAGELIEPQLKIEVHLSRPLQSTRAGQPARLLYRRH
ncbi:HlyD family efflux transporter periplasmic adaptor subunit [Roseimaritima sediminicola]|uniref:HlyD family efflux transporter periplasmic adaptor subunit n=1 Tax=Roseimaritima sediminicola TaxID=2662066 RepID=UPI0012982D76|nr:HlyD family efflux transporter periplasmic adaptor subunit [Roseimaritima sediminicola]